MPLRVLFLDLNSYFASVEQAERPELIGKAVAVVPMMAETTSCLAASYPAKARGVRTGTLVKDARRMCPGIIFIEADHRRYVNYHNRIIAAVEKCLPVSKVHSIDEVAIELFGREQELDFARNKALEIKQRIKEDVHPSLTCSIGIAPNRYLAKIASDMQKPDGLIIIRDQDLPHCLHKLTLRDFPGIGPKTEERLFAAHCRTAKELCEKSIPEMRALWGSKFGEDFWKLIRGQVIDRPENPRATINHSRVLSPDSRTFEHAWSNLVALLSKAAARLRDENLFARSLHISIKLLGRNESDPYWDRHIRFFETQDSAHLLNELKRIWREAPKQRILQVGVTLGGLVPATKHQLSLFEDQAQAKLMFALDKLNKKIRKNLIVFGSSVELEKATRAPIAFGHIPKEFE